LYKLFFSGGDVYEIEKNMNIWIFAMANLACLRALYVQKRHKRAKSKLLDVLTFQALQKDGLRQAQ
jgi:hypothetical protein